MKFKQLFLKDLSIVKNYKFILLLYAVIFIIICIGVNLYTDSEVNESEKDLVGHIKSFYGDKKDLYSALLKSKGNETLIRMIEDKAKSELKI